MHDTPHHSVPLSWLNYLTVCEELRHYKKLTLVLSCDEVRYRNWKYCFTDVP